MTSRRTCTSDIDVIESDYWILVAICIWTGRKIGCESSSELQNKKENSVQCGTTESNTLKYSSILLCKTCVKTCLKLIVLKNIHSYTRNIKDGKEKGSTFSKI